MSRAFIFAEREDAFLAPAAVLPVEAAAAAVATVVSFAAVSVVFPFPAVLSILLSSVMKKCSSSDGFVPSAGERVSAAKIQNLLFRTVLRNVNKMTHVWGQALRNTHISSEAFHRHIDSVVHNLDYHCTASAVRLILSQSV